MDYAMPDHTRIECSCGTVLAPGLLQVFEVLGVFFATNLL